MTIKMTAEQFRLVWTLVLEHAMLEKDEAAIAASELRYWAQLALEASEEPGDPCVVAAKVAGALAEMVDHPGNHAPPGSPA